MPTPFTLSVSIVLYKTPLAMLRVTIASVLQAVDCAREAGELAAVTIALVDNDAESALQEAMSDWQTVMADRQIGLRLWQGHGNIGYGRGHNRALKDVQSDVHLVLNPDVTLARNCLLEGLKFLRAETAVVAVSPRIDPGDGSTSHGCKRYPSVFDLFLRGFARPALKQRFRKRLDHYAMSELASSVPLAGIPIISGCFMLFRTEVLKRVGGFHEAYFLYFEDFDLSIRARAYGLLAYVPSMQIVHFGGNAAHKGLRHIAMFARSGLRFYNSHGWRLW
jgi:hypothetical protein